MAHQAGAYPGFCSIKRLGILLLPPGWDASLMLLNLYLICLLYFFGVGETASNLGTAMDELMRHQPTLKTDAMTAIIKVFYYTLHHSH